MTRLLKDLQAARDRAEDMRDEARMKMDALIDGAVSDRLMIKRAARDFARHSADAARWHERISTLLELGEAK